MLLKKKVVMDERRKILFYSNTRCIVKMYCLNEICWSRQVVVNGMKETYSRGWVMRQERYKELCAGIV